MFHPSVFTPMTGVDEKLFRKFNAMQECAPSSLADVVASLPSTAFVANDTLQRLTSRDFYMLAATEAANSQSASTSLPAVSTAKYASELKGPGESSSLLESLQLDSAATRYYFSGVQKEISIPPIVQQQPQLQQNFQLHNAHSLQLSNTPSTSAFNTATLNSPLHKAIFDERHLAANQALLNSIFAMQKMIAEHEIREQQLRYNSQLLYKAQQQQLITLPLATTSAATAAVNAPSFRSSDTNIRTLTMISNNFWLNQQQQYQQALEYLRKQQHQELLLEYERLLSKEHGQQQQKQLQQPFKQQQMAPYLTVETTPHVGSAFRAYRDCDNALPLKKSEIDAAVVDFSEEENVNSCERRHISTDSSDNNTTLTTQMSNFTFNNINKQHRQEQENAAETSTSLNMWLQLPNPSASSAIVGRTTLRCADDVAITRHNSIGRARMHNEENEKDRLHMPQLLPECITFDGNDYDNSVPPPLDAYDAEIDAASATRIKCPDNDKAANTKRMTSGSVFAPLSIDCCGLQAGTTSVDCCYLQNDAIASSSITPPPESPQPPLLAFADVRRACRTETLQTAASSITLQSTEQHGLLSENRALDTGNDLTNFSLSHGSLPASSSNSVNWFSEFLPVNQTKHSFNLITSEEINTSVLKSTQSQGVNDDSSKVNVLKIDKSSSADEVEKMAVRIDNDAKLMNTTSDETSLPSEVFEEHKASKGTTQSYGGNVTESLVKNKKAPKINKTVKKLKLDTGTDSSNANVSVISITETVKLEERCVSQTHKLLSPQLNMTRKIPKTRKNVNRKTKTIKPKNDRSPKLTKFFPIVMSTKNVARKSSIVTEKNSKRKIVEKDKLPAVKPKKARCETLKRSSTTAKNKLIDIKNGAKTPQTAKRQPGYRRRRSSSNKVSHYKSATKLQMGVTRKNKSGSRSGNVADKKEVKKVQSKQANDVNVARSCDKTMFMRASQKRKGPKIRSASTLKIVSNWRPIGEGQFMALSCSNESSGVRRRCFDAMRHWSELDVIVRVGDCVKICSSEDLENIGKIVHLYYDETSKAVMTTVLWYYTQFQIDTSRGISTCMMHKNELLASEHVDTINADCIEGLVYVLTCNEYCRFLAESRQRDSLIRLKDFEMIWTRAEGEYPRRAMLSLEDTPHDSLYFCRAIYSIKTKKLCYTVCNSNCGMRSAKPANHLSSRLKYKTKGYRRKNP